MTKNWPHSQEAIFTADFLEFVIVEYVSIKEMVLGPEWRDK